MRRIAIFFILIFSFSFLSADEKAAKLTIENSTHDFGEVIKGDIVEHDFIIKNRGDGKLVIADVRPSCGCTVVKYDKVLESGKEGKIHAKLDTKDYTGPNKWHITVESNDPEIPYLKLFLKATVKTIVTVIPKHSIRFTKLERETTTNSVTVVTEKAGNDFQVSDPKSDKDYITASVKPVPDNQRDPTYPNRQFMLQIEIGPEAPVGTVNATVTLKTNEPKVPTVTVRLLGLVRPAVMVAPPVITSGPVATAADFKRTLMVVDSADEPSLTVTSVSSDLGFLKFEVEEMVPKKQYKINVNLSEDVPSGPFNGTVSIQCDYPDKHYRTITVPVRGELKE